MSTTDESAQKARFQAFWDRMARTYALPFDEERLALTNQVIDMVKGKGVHIADSAILDIACGTGNFTLPLAREAASVTGLDDSAIMLERMQEVISSSAITNVTAVKACWHEADINALGFEKAFDTSWLSMSPAVRSWEDFEKMERCARSHCVYIGWGRKRDNAFMEEIFALHDLTYAPPPGATGVYQMLKDAGRKPSLDYFATHWDSDNTPEEAFLDISCFIEMQGGRPQTELIEAFLARHLKDGRIRHTTYVEEGLLVWQV